MTTKEKTNIKAFIEKAVNDTKETKNQSLLVYLPFALSQMEKLDENSEEYKLYAKYAELASTR